MNTIEAIKFLVVFYINYYYREDYRLLKTYFLVVPHTIYDLKML